MGEVSRYPNGTFCWVELGTPEVDGAKRFYTELFGWETDDLPMPDGGVYVMCRIEGKDVAAIHHHQQDEGTGWSSYISVDDVESATSMAHDAGATVLMQPFDVADAARMSLIRDPAGAVVALWERRSHMGARLVNDVGAWSWSELVTPELNAAKAFYASVFGWAADEIHGPIPRLSFTLGNLLVGGAHGPTPAEGDEPRWTISFTVAEADAAAATAEGLGGRVLLPPMDIPVGRFAILADPAGAAFTVAAVPGGAFRGVDGS
jgi:uncharacterized protein